MPAYNFQKQFVPLILDGLKPHTIRKKRKHPTKVGDTLKLFIGMRTKQCFQFAEVVCTTIEPVAIYPFDMWMRVNGLVQSEAEDILIARADGFETREDFYKFFERYKEEILYDFEMIWWNPTEMKKVRYGG